MIKLGEVDLDGIARHVAQVAARTVPGATDVSITLVAGRRPRTAASTSELAVALDGLQYRYEAGPCLQAAVEHAVVLVSDAARDTRWNLWPAQAAAAGAGSVLSVPMPMREDLDAALNIYGREPDAFDDEAVRVACIFAEHAVVTLDNAYLYDRSVSLVAQMQTAMEHRAVIEQAKGIIMADRRCTPEEAFVALSRMSQDSNRKLRQIAAALVERTQSPSVQRGR
ncbi:GAF and ANTAR domain-containing protein [Asanoa sp. NPDC049518]|uniref:GAF and ANTAR domain-containing protein n=1 Tax=unclassified Asanoa TaxID=2685164 RepID=UPI00342101D0